MCVCVSLCLCLSLSLSLHVSLCVLTLRLLRHRCCVAQLFGKHVLLSVQPSEVESDPDARLVTVHDVRSGDVLKLELPAARAKTLPGSLLRAPGRDAQPLPDAWDALAVRLSVLAEDDGTRRLIFS